MSRREKEEIVSHLSKEVEGFQAVVLTNFRGLNVEQMNQLRRRLKEEKISYHVVKNTLMKLASKGTDLEKIRDHFQGPTAVAISYGDPTLLAKILTEFIKSQPALEIKVGLIQGKVATPEEVKSLATVPSREILMSQVMGAIQAPGSQLAGVIQSALQQVLGVIQARADQLAGSGAEGGT